MDLGVIGNRRSAAGDLMLPVKLLEYVSLGIPAVVPAENHPALFQRRDGDVLRTGKRRIAGGCCCPALRQPEPPCEAGRGRTGFLTRYGWQRQGAELVTMYQELVEN